MLETCGCALGGAGPCDCASRFRPARDLVVVVGCGAHPAWVRCLRPGTPGWSCCVLGEDRQLRGPTPAIHGGLILAALLGRSVIARTAWHGRRCSAALRKAAKSGLLRTVYGPTVSLIKCLTAAIRGDAPAYTIRCAGLAARWPPAHACRPTTTGPTARETVRSASSDPGTSPPRTHGCFGCLGPQRCFYAVWSKRASVRQSGRKEPASARSYR